MEKLILIGAGGHAISCIETIERQGIYRIAGLVGMADEVGNKLLGYEVFCTDAGLGGLVAQYPNALITLGQIKSAEARIVSFDCARCAGFSFPVIASPFAAISPHAEIGEGTIIMHGAVVNAGTKIGRNCIINSRALVEHGTMIGDHCHISTGAILNGDVTIGTGSFVGSGSVVRQGIAIGENCIIGMGAAVWKNVDDARTLTGDMAQ